MSIRLVVTGAAAFLVGVAVTLGVAPAFTKAPAATPDRDPTLIPITPADRRALADAHATDRWLDDEILFREGLRRGFAWDDLIVRRELQRRMRAALVEAQPATPPDDVALEAFLAAHADRYQAPARRSFEQVFLGRAAHGSKLDADALAVGEQLRADPLAYAGLGDAVPGGATRTAVTDDDVEADFGGAFARAVAAAPAGTWTGPIRSPLGAHWVRVTGAEPSRPLALAQVRTRVRADYDADRQQQVLRTALDALRVTYRVVDDPTAVQPALRSADADGDAP